MRRSCVLYLWSHCRNEKRGDRNLSSLPRHNSLETRKHQGAEGLVRALDGNLADGRACLELDLDEKLLVRHGFGSEVDGSLV